MLALIYYYLLLFIQLHSQIFIHYYLFSYYLCVRDCISSEIEASMLHLSVNSISKMHVVVPNSIRGSTPSRIPAVSGTFILK